MKILQETRDSILYSLVINNNEIDKGNYLYNDELKIFHDHLKFNCKHIIVRTNIGNCYLIGKKVIKRNLPFLHIIYLSDKNLFNKYINYIRNDLMLELKIIGIIIYERFLMKYPIANSIKYNVGFKRMYKSEVLNENNIDYLYSELMLFDYKTV